MTQAQDIFPIVTPLPVTYDRTAYRWDNVWPFSMRLHVCRECRWTKRQSARFASVGWDQLSSAARLVIARKDGAK